jgi:hypothetical protein
VLLERVLLLLVQLVEQHCCQMDCQSWAQQSLVPLTEHFVDQSTWVVACAADSSLCRRPCWRSLCQKLYLNQRARRELLSSQRLALLDQLAWQVQLLERRTDQLVLEQQVQQPVQQVQLALASLGQDHRMDQLVQVLPVPQLELLDQLALLDRLLVVRLQVVQQVRLALASLGQDHRMDQLVQVLPVPQLGLLDQLAWQVQLLEFRTDRLVLELPVQQPV